VRSRTARWALFKFEDRADLMEILGTDGLTKRFGTLTAVDNMTISLTQGEFFGLLGPNGAGKTTAIKMLITLLPPTAGSARVAGYDIRTQSSQVRRHIGYVPQLLSADGQLTGYENLLIFARLFDVPRGEVRSRAEDALDFMGLQDAADILVRKYSGGMIRRLEIAQSMLHRPQMLFLDEPTLGLDPVARRTVWEHLTKLRQDFKTTIMMTTHYMDEADELCNRVAIMHLGRVVAIGTPAMLKARIGKEDATLDDVFTHYTGGPLESAGGYRETSRVRRTAHRLG
jgi:ABC-2 type transport system ATP-binding protein